MSEDDEWEDWNAPIDDIHAACQQARREINNLAESFKAGARRWDINWRACD